MTDLAKLTKTANQGDGPADTKAAGMRLIDRGNHLRHQGRPAAAARCYRKALAIFERRHGPDHPVPARVLINLGVVLDAGGLHTEAEEIHRLALAIFERVLGANEIDTAIARVNLAGTLMNRRGYAEAAQHYSKALAIFERAHGPDHELTITVARLLRTALAHQERSRRMN